MSSDKTPHDIAVGVIGNDEYGPAIATRIAACGYRALYTALAH